MMQQRIGLAAPPDRHHQSVGDELGRHAGAHRPADHAPREQIDDGGHVEPAFRGPDIGEVGDPFAVRSSRFEAAVTQVRGELIGLRASVPGTAPAEMSAFLDLHVMILDDPNLSDIPRQLIRARRCNAEWALVQQMETVVEQFERIEDPYLRERKQDVVQVVDRVLKALVGQPRTIPAPRHPEEESILVAHDLSPADMILFKRHKFGGFVTDVGGVTSHTAIVARGLGIPAIVGCTGALALPDGVPVLVDGRDGTVIADPTSDEVTARTTREEALRARAASVTGPGRLSDGTPVALMATRLFEPMPEM